MENRRSFLARTTAAAVSAGAAPGILGANERITLGLIGGRNQGRHVAKRAVKAGANVKTFCDIDEAILAKVSPELTEAQGKAPATETDYRRVLEDKDIDAVVIATPDHWHTHMSLEALAAGKDVYIEKPLSQTIHEGHLIREAARKYDRVVQVGTQRRSGEYFHTAADYVASGKLGKLCLIKAWGNQLRPSIGNPPNGTPPPSVDYNQWLGPAPELPFNKLRFHYNWRFFWDYGNSELGNQGIHMIDVAMMAIQKMRGLENCLPSRVSSNGGIYWLDDMKEVPDTQVVTYDFDDFMMVWELRSFGKHHPMESVGFGTAFYGTDASLVADGNGWKVYDKDGGIAATGEQTPLLHEQDFLECVKSRKRPRSDIEIGRLSTTICHLGNISYHLGRDIKFNPKTEDFGDDQAANSQRYKTYRKGFELPKV